MPRKVSTTHPDKVLFEEISITKKELIDYYIAVFDHMKPFLQHRPIVIERYTEGVGKKGFFQQEIPDYFPDWISRIEVERKEKNKQDMLEIHTRSALHYVVNQDAISFHRWLSVKKALTQPDMLLFDLDPPSKSLEEVIQVAKQLRKLIQEYGAHSFVMTTGSKGLHLIVPITPKHSFRDTRKIAKRLAQECADQIPELATTEIRKNKRANKVFIDYLRNSYGQTSICPYSVRTKPQAPIAAPLHWDELTKSLDAQKYHIKNIQKRIEKIDDPFKDLKRHRVSLEIFY